MLTGPVPHGLPIPNHSVHPGAPPLRRRPRRVPGETLRWQINYRFSCYHGWSYRLDTLNLAYGTAFPPDVFLTPPTRNVDERARLF
ncbi:hypothetical protein ABZ801_17625 [Actinomadura sp. NPDC047616]|uniref:hypothetical protein n=1 Tax=Actinomadura sp. NPDC047616 TaxID=3155914 RepID=UPI0033D85599